ncbi:MAG: phosphoenolpyruvate synthase, partial [Mycobacterium sp.]|nr:phosphoenolpyruvate synthase [Mycobacterium sp.]
MTLAGRKAATLHELAAAGFAVPPGFVIEPTLNLADHDDETLHHWITACGGFPVAVRSSGLMEDLDEASFAGLYETYLGIDSVAALRRRVSDCRQSAHSERLQAYLEHHGLT